MGLKKKKKKRKEKKRKEEKKKKEEKKERKKDKVGRILLSRQSAGTVSSRLALSLQS